MHVHFWNILKKSNSYCFNSETWAVSPQMSFYPNNLTFRCCKSTMFILQTCFISLSFFFVFVYWGIFCTYPSPTRTESVFWVSTLQWSGALRRHHMTSSLGYRVQRLPQTTPSFELIRGILCIHVCSVECEQIYVIMNSMGETTLPSPPIDLQESHALWPMESLLMST